MIEKAERKLTVERRGFRVPRGTLLTLKVRPYQGNDEIFPLPMFRLCLSPNPLGTRAEREEEEKKTPGRVSTSNHLLSRTDTWETHVPTRDRQTKTDGSGRQMDRERHLRVSPTLCTPKRCGEEEEPRERKHLQNRAVSFL